VLTVGRLIPDKKRGESTLVIEAMAGDPETVIVAGEGPERDPGGPGRAQRVDAHFQGYVDRERWRRYSGRLMRRARSAPK